MHSWYSLSNPAMEDALIEVPTNRRFAGSDLVSEHIPKETTILAFRHWLEKQKLGEQIFKPVNAELNFNGIAMKQATIIDATLIAAPSSSKNKAGGRHLEVHQTKKGSQRYHHDAKGFATGMKINIGADKDSGHIHSVETTAANVHDFTPAAELLHGEEEVVNAVAAGFCEAVAGYQGIEKRPEIEGKSTTFPIAMRPGPRPALPNTADGRLDDLIGTAKAHALAKGEHPIRAIK